MRTDGYLPLRDYAVIGDGRTAALVGRDGSVDWLALPNMDSPTVFAAVLDVDRGGSFALRPRAPFRVARRYVPDTNVLETTFTTDSGVLRVTDALTLSHDGTLSPERELQRRAECVSGSVAMHWVVRPRFGYGAHRPRWSWRGGVPVAAHGSAAVAVRSFDAGHAVLDDDAVAGQFTLRAGENALLVMSFADREPLVLPSRADCDVRMAATETAWAGWVACRRFPDRWRDAVLRSALAIKLLVFAPSGAIAAAATTSLPEHIGGVRNWDYRYSWVRDSALALNAFLHIDGMAEARAYYWWLMHASQLSHPRLRVLYGLDGGQPGREKILPLAGYRNSSPVRLGNAAAGQLQLDTYGELLQSNSLYAEAVGRLSSDMAHRITSTADYVCSIWQQPDAGIWEVRGELMHFTQSKMMCWVALDRAAVLAERGMIPDRHMDHWRATQSQIRDFIQTRCVSTRHGCYSRSAGSDDVDAAVLLGLLHGYTDGADPLMRATVEAVNTELRHGVYVHRYSAADGLAGAEGAFLPCSFWLADGLARVGRPTEAVAMMDELVGLANDVGLYSEEINPATGAFLGNLPQALTHLALINAAHTISALCGREVR